MKMSHVAALMLGTVLTVGQVSADTTMRGYQGVNIYSDNWWTSMVYSFTTGSSTSGGSTYGDGRINYPVTQFDQDNGQYHGAYVYDYTAGRFTEVAFSVFDQI